MTILSRANMPRSRWRAGRVYLLDRGSLNGTLRNAQKAVGWFRWKTGTFSSSASAAIASRCSLQPARTRSKRRARWRPLLPHIH